MSRFLLLSTLRMLFKLRFDGTLAGAVALCTIPGCPDSETSTAPPPLNISSNSISLLVGTLGTFPTTYGLPFNVAAGFQPPFDGESE